MGRRGIVIVAAATALMNLAAPAYAVTEADCTELEGRIEGEGGERTCVFPLSPTACAFGFAGTTAEDEAEDEPEAEAEPECIVPIE